MRNDFINWKASCNFGSYLETEEGKTKKNKTLDKNKNAGDEKNLHSGGRKIFFYQFNRIF